MIRSYFILAFDPRINDYVEPSQVTSGKNCACICPTCKAPVIAKKGTTNRWHFAHDHHAFGHVQAACDYNLLLSIRQIARQVFSEEMDLTTPAYTRSVTEQLAHRALSESYVVTDSKVLRLKAPRVNYQCEMGVVDVCCEFKDYKLLIYLTHAGRAVPEALQRPSDPSCGVLCINLDWIAEFIEQDASSQMSYKDIIREWLSSDTEHKHWICHPREGQAREDALQRLNAKVAPYLRHRKLALRAPLLSSRIEEIADPKKKG